MGELISAQAFFIFRSVFAALLVTISALGICANILNVLIFSRMGLKDSTTISLFFLSVSDTGVLTMGFMVYTTVSFELMEQILGPTFPIQPFGILFFAVKLREMLYNISVWTTTFLAVQRCCCVTMPLHFKGVFTKAKTVKTLMGIIVFTFASYAPAFSVLRMVTSPPIEEWGNETRLILQFTPLKKDMWIYEEGLNGIAIPIITQVTVVLCLVLMGRSLMESAQVRTTLSTGTTKESSGNADLRRGKAKGKTSSKELQVMKAVAVVALVFVVCNTPKILKGWTRRFYPSFDIGKEYQSIYRTVSNLQSTSELLNASVNIFIYYKFNGKFRQTLRGSEVKTSGQLTDLPPV